MAETIEVSKETLTSLRTELRGLRTRINTALAAIEGITGIGDSVPHKKRLEDYGEIVQWTVEELFYRMEKAGVKSTGNKLAAAPWVDRLIRKVGADESNEVAKAIRWLYTDNLKEEASFVVESGRALYEKWPRIRNRMKLMEAKKQKKESPGLEDYPGI